MKDISKEKLYGIVGTLLFHVLLVLLLYFVVMEQVPVQPEKSNIEMQSAVEDFAGEEFFEAKTVADVRPQQPKTDPAPETPVKEPLIAQNSEESIPVDTVSSKKKDEKPKPVVSEADKRRKEEAERKAAEEAARRAAEEAERKAKEKIASNVADAFKTKSSSGGKNSAVGVDGDTQDGTDNGGLVGSGSTGISASVGNRKVVKTLERKIQVQEEGVVKVDVTVDPQGRVVDANAKTASLTLKREAEKAAREIRFNVVPGNTGNEVGTITFRFNMSY